MRIQSSPNVDRVAEEDLPRFTAIALAEIIRSLNNNLSFVDNFASQTISAVFTAANTDTSTAHNLGRVPVGYLVIGLSAAMIVYNGSIASTTSVLTLRSSATGTATVVVF